MFKKKSILIIKKVQKENPVTKKIKNKIFQKK